MGRESNTDKPEGGREIPVEMPVQDPEEREEDGKGPLPPYDTVEGGEAEPKRRE